MGPRQSGKSTLNRLIAASTAGSTEERLDDAATLEAARADPGRFVRHDRLLVIDEIQRAPELLLAIKQEVDLDPRPGRFLLSGSADVLAMSRASDSLAGRVEIIELLPFSQVEIDRSPDGLLECLLTDTFEPPGADGGPDLVGYVERAVRGGFPEVVAARSERSRSRFFSSYLQTLLERDARDISRIRRPSQLDTVMRILVDRQAMPLAIESAARDTGLPRSTFEDHLSLLKRLYLIRDLSAFADSATKRAVKQRKLLVVDAGLAAWLQGRDVRDVMSDPRSLGQTVEGLVLLELIRQASWLDPRIRISHYRSKDGAEVDALIEGPRRHIVGIEVKATETPRDGHFRHLRHLRARLGPRFRRGVVLHAGRTTAQYEDEMWALPISSLWTTPSPASRNAERP